MDSPYYVLLPVAIEPVIPKISIYRLNILGGWRLTNFSATKKFNLKKSLKITLLMSQNSWEAPLLPYDDDQKTYTEFQTNQIEDDFEMELDRHKKIVEELSEDNFYALLNVSKNVLLILSVKEGAKLFFLRPQNCRLENHIIVFLAHSILINTIIQISRLFLRTNFN